MGKALQADTDPLAAQEMTILNSMLAALHPKATGDIKAGIAPDPESIDRVIKIIALKRQLRADEEQKGDCW